LRNSYPVVLFIFLCSCVQKMGTDGHLRPQQGNSSLMAVSLNIPEDTIPQSTAEQKRPIEQGREQYQIFCMPCHGQSGYGNGMIVQRGFLAPPSYHIDRLRKAADMHFFDVITHGYGAMYSYADRVSESDRWAIVAYIRALQLSQNIRWEELPIEDQERLRKVGEQ
jgi:mono/diheme cytochrome c family protein